MLRQYMASLLVKLFLKPVSLCARNDIFGLTKLNMLKIEVLELIEVQDKLVWLSKLRCTVLPIYKKKVSIFSI